LLKSTTYARRQLFIGPDPKKKDYTDGNKLMITPIRSKNKKAMDVMEGKCVREVLLGIISEDLEPVEVEEE
jgi:hypothetical protein